MGCCTARCWSLIACLATLAWTYLLTADYSIKNVGRINQRIQLPAKRVCVQSLNSTDVDFSDVHGKWSKHDYGNNTVCFEKEYKLTNEDKWDFFDLTVNVFIVFSTFILLVGLLERKPKMVLQWVFCVPVYGILNYLYLAVKFYVYNVLLITMGGTPLHTLMVWSTCAVYTHYRDLKRKVIDAVDNVGPSDI